jgi:anthranilate synthase/aminodeoxychorismate synthase-like glutamine amidotransferase
MLDNYDSFTYNLVQYLGMLKAKVKVFRNDEITIDAIKKLKPKKIVISPGPGRPEDAGISCDCIRAFGKDIPLLGVCLGHQAIGYTFGAKITNARILMHGKTSQIHHTGEGIFKGLDNPFEATRYHSLVVDRKHVPSCLKVIAWTSDKEIMGLRHTRYPIWGVQFHPESVLTAAGLSLLKNFLSL